MPKTAPKKTAACKAKPISKQPAAPVLKLDPDPAELRLLNHRGACLATVATFLEQTDIPVINLLTDLASEMDTTTRSRQDVVRMGLKLLREFISENDVVLPVPAPGARPLNARREPGSGISDHSRVPLSDAEFFHADEGELAFLGQCLRLHRNLICNSTTPLEDFLVSEIFWYDQGYRRTPDDMVERVNDEEHFRGWFDDAVETAKIMQRDFPELLTAEASK